MADWDGNEREEARRRARERLAARQQRNVADEGRRAPRAPHQDQSSRRNRADDGEQDYSDDQGSRRNRDSYDERGRDEGIVSRMLGAVGSFVDRVGLMRIALVAGIVVLLIIVAVVIGSCTKGCSADDPNAADPGQEQTEPVEVNIPDGIEAGLKARLETAAAGNADIAWIANHADQYTADGEAVQVKLLDLAIDEPEAVGFVRDYLDRYPSDTAEAYTDEVTQGTVPHLYQWDKRWGYTTYSSTAFALTGCCPTALSMVYMGLTGNNDISPYDMGVRAQEGGYMTEYEGTDASFLTEAAPDLGLSCTDIGVDADAVRSALDAGQVVICDVGPGDFTSSGHYFVITGINEDGTVTINDPYSAVRSAQTWDVDTIVGQTIAFYAYGLA